MQSSTARRQVIVPESKQAFDVFELANRLGWTATELSALRSIYERAVAFDNGQRPPVEDREEPEEAPA